MQKSPYYSWKSSNENGLCISHVSFQNDSSLKSKPEDIIFTKLRLGAICSLLLASYLLWVFYVSCRQKISDISESRGKVDKNDPKPVI